MARLTEVEKVQLRRPLTNGSWRQPEPRPLSFKSYLEFLAAAHRFNRQTKPVCFKGDHWKL